MKQTDQGIFLYRTAFSDTSLIVTYYTAGSGLRKFVFKGGKKKAHQLFPLAPSELTYYGRPESDLLQLTQSEPLFASDFQFDPVKSTIAFFIAEAIRKCVHEFDADQRMFDFLKSKVQSLQNADDNEISHFPLCFLVDFAEMLGIQPLATPNGQFFDLDEGNIGDYAPAGNRIEQGVHVDCIVRLIQGEKVNIPKATRDKALQLLMDYYKTHVPGLHAFETYDIVHEILS